MKMFGGALDRRPAGDLDREREIHVWSVDLYASETHVSHSGQLLSPNEVARAQRLTREVVRRRFVATRVALREILSQYLDREPAKIEFEYGAHGKPGLAAGMRKDVEFSVSHSADLAMIAVTRAREVGIDLEVTARDLDYLGIARRFFAADEAQALEGQSEAGAREGFFRCWTRKEAFLKARGDGLSLPLEGFSVTVDRDRAPALLATRWNPREVDEWQLADLSAPAGFAAAIAYRGDRAPIVQAAWSSPGEL